MKSVCHFPLVNRLCLFFVLSIVAVSFSFVFASHKVVCFLFFSLYSSPNYWRLFFFLLPLLPAHTSQGFTHHQHTPSISAATINPAQYAGAVENTQLRTALTKTHGVLMVTAWPVLAGTAVHLAAFLKPVLKNGKWFQVGMCLHEFLNTHVHFCDFSFIHSFITICGNPG